MAEGSNHGLEKLAPPVDKLTARSWTAVDTKPADQIKQNENPNSALRRMVKMAGTFAHRFTSRRERNIIVEPVNSSELIPSTEDPPQVRSKLNTGGLGLVSLVEDNKTLEIPAVPPRTYIGLERLDEIAEPERYIKGGLHFAKLRQDTERTASLQSKLDKIEAERQAIFEKCNAVDLVKAREVELGVDEDTGEQRRVTDFTSLSYLLIDRAANELQPVEEGYIRMYRGEGPHPGKTNDEATGTWFSPNLGTARAARFGIPFGGTRRLIYVDIPKTGAEKYSVEKNPNYAGASKGGEYQLSRETVAQAKEFIRFLKADTVGDPWASLSQSSPQVVETK